MSTAVATRVDETGARAGSRRDHFRSALDAALAEADADERIGPALRAVRLRLRFVFTDSGVVLDLAAVEDGDRNLIWSFDGPTESEPKLELQMDSEVANLYLQGRESLAVGIAHGQIRIRGESRIALLYLPATRLLCEPYRRVIRDRFPELVAG